MLATALGWHRRRLLRAKERRLFAGGRRFHWAEPLFGGPSAGTREVTSAPQGKLASRGRGESGYRRLPGPICASRQAEPVNVQQRLVRPWIMGLHPSRFNSGPERALRQTACGIGLRNGTVAGEA